MFPINKDEIIIIGGSNQLSAEIRTWNRDLEDYNFEDAFFSVNSSEHLYPPYQYTPVLPTFSIKPKKLKLQNQITFNTSSSFILCGSEDSFILEITEEHQIKFHMTPLSLKLRNYQVSIRIYQNYAILIGGKSKIGNRSSREVFLCDISNMNCIKKQNMNHPRYDFTAVQLDVIMIYI